MIKLAFFSYRFLSTLFLWLSFPIVSVSSLMPYTLFLHKKSANTIDDSFLRISPMMMFSPSFFTS
jgi:hypothetical protein